MKNYIIYIFPNYAEIEQMHMGQIFIYEMGRNLKMMANKKVKAGTKLLIAEERVGELKLIPVYPMI